MKTRAIQWTLVCLFLVNCNAFVLDSTTWVTAVAKESAEAKDKTHIRRIAKLDEPSGDHQNLEQIINLVTVKDPEEQLPSEQLKPLTYKDLCQILGNYHISKQSNHYYLLENSGKMQHN